MISRESFQTARRMATGYQKTLRSLWVERERKQGKVLRLANSTRGKSMGGYLGVIIVKFRQKGV